MARKPNYDFERRERDKAKAAKVEERTRTKAEKTGSRASAIPGMPGDHPSEGLIAPSEGVGTTT